MKNYKVNENGFYEIYDEALSEKEFFERYTICEECGAAIDIDEAIFVDDCYICEDCLSTNYTFCDECCNYVKTENVHQFADSNAYVCDDCAENYWTCYDCGRLFRDGYHVAEGDDGNDYCEDCIGDHRCNLINDYHDFKEMGEYRFCGNESREETPYMGFELEVDSSSSFNKGRVVREIEDTIPDYFHYEYDGSLDNGFEIISQPSSLSYILGFMDEFEDVSLYMTTRGISSHNARSCGLHVHIDKRFFGKSVDTAEAKLVYLFERHWENLMRFSRRKSGQLHWCEQYMKPCSDVVKDSKKGNLERYHAVNLTNDDTIEIRMWRGTLRPETFEATMRFTDRLARIVKETPSPKLVKMTFADLLGDDPVILDYWKTVKNREV